MNVHGVPLFMQIPPLLLSNGGDSSEQTGDVVFVLACIVLRGQDYNSLGGELKHTDGSSHVMQGLTLVSFQGDVWTCFIVPLHGERANLSFGKDYICSQRPFDLVCLVFF